MTPHPHFLRQICAVAVDIATSPPPESVIESSAAIVAALSKLSPFLRSLTLSRGPFLKVRLCTLELQMIR